MRIDIGPEHNYICQNAALSGEGDCGWRAPTSRSALFVNLVKLVFADTNDFVFVFITSWQLSSIAPLPPIPEDLLPSESPLSISFQLEFLWKVLQASESAFSFYPTVFPQYS